MRRIWVRSVGDLVFPVHAETLEPLSCGCYDPMHIEGEIGYWKWLDMKAALDKEKIKQRIRDGAEAER